MGGGALVAPSLYVLLGLDYGPSVALSLIYSLFTKIVGAAQHLRQGTVLWRITLVYGLLGIPGAILGSWMIYWMPGAAGRAFPLLMSAVLLMVAALLVLETSIPALASRHKPFSPHRITRLGVVAIGAFQLLVGALLGLTSIGSGSLVILSMVYLFRMSARQIVGTNLVIALIMVVPAGLAHYVSGGVDGQLLAALLVGSIAGAVLGARCTLVLPDRALKLTIAALIVAGAGATILKAS